MTVDIVPILMIVCLIIGVLSGHPLVFVLGGTAVIFGYFGWGGPAVFSVLIQRVWGVMSNYVLVAAPLFIFMGCILQKAGMAEQLFGGIETLMPRLRGGLATGTVIICTALAATTGIIGASVVTAGLLALPPMLKRGYQKELALGTVAASGTLGILIPPSIMLILFAAETGLSAGKLFAGAIVPGLLLSGTYITYITVKAFTQPHLAPLVEREKLPSAGALLLWALKSFAPVVLLILGVLGAIFAGIATPTEAAGMGAFIALIIAAFYRRLSLENLKAIATRSLSITSMALGICVTASMFTAVFIPMGGRDMITNLLIGTGFGPWGILALMMLILFILGMFIDWIGILLICLPIFMPISNMLGFHPIWFALMVCVNLQMSFLTPPFGYALFYLKGIVPPGVTTMHIYRGIIPFVGLQILVLIICALFPFLITWLPTLLIK